MITLQVNSSVCQVSVQRADWPICPFQSREGKGKEMDAAARPLSLKPPRPQSEKQRTIECQSLCRLKDKGTVSRASIYTSFHCETLRANERLHAVEERTGLV